MRPTGAAGASQAEGVNRPVIARRGSRPTRTCPAGGTRAANGRLAMASLSRNPDSLPTGAAGLGQRHRANRPGYAPPVAPG